jgi:hypothetical protein
VAALSVQAGESVRLRFRGELAGGRVARPPGSRVRLRVYVPGGTRLLDLAECEWDGREWSAVLDTSHWGPGTYTAQAVVSGDTGSGAEWAEIEVTPPGDNPPS